MKLFEVLHTDRIRIRKFQARDRNKLIELLCDKSVTQYMAFPEEILTEKGVSDLLQNTLDSYGSEKPFLSYAITLKKEDSLIGVTGYNPLSDSEIEVFYALLPSCWGKGYASEILVKITDYVLSSGEYNIVVAPITRANKASIKVAEKAGFVNHGLQQHPDYEDLVLMFKKERGPL